MNYIKRLKRFFSAPIMNIIILENEKRFNNCGVAKDYFYDKEGEWEWSHTLEAGRLIPMEVFETNPECFAIVNGVRIKSQTCLSNEMSLSIVKETLKRMTNLHPEYKYWSVSQGDNPKWCQCAKCRKELPFNTLINFLNKVAAEFPDKQIHTLLYYKTENIGTVKPLSNVLVMPTTIQLSKHKSYCKQYFILKRNDCVIWVKNLRKLLKLTDNVGIWDYNADFKQLLATNPCLYSLKGNIRWFRWLGIQNFIIHTDGATMHDGSFFKEKLIEFMLNKPWQNPSRVLYNIWKTSFGNAADKIKEYYDLVCSQTQKFDSYENNLKYYRKGYLSDKNLKKYTDILDDAYDNESTRDVWDLRIGVLYAKIELNIASKIEIEQFIMICKRRGDVTVNETKKSWTIYLKEKGIITRKLKTDEKI